MNRIFLIPISTALVASTVSAQPVPPQPGETLAAISATARAARLKGDVPTWLSYATKTLALTPDHPDILVSVARANAAAGQKEASLAMLDQAVGRGAGFDPSRFPEFKALTGDSRFESLADGARRNLSPVAKATTFTDIGDRSSEGIAYDPVSNRLFAGTERGELFAVEMDGKISPFVSGGGLRQVLGVKVDPKRRLLWAVSGQYPEPNPGPDAPADMGTGGIRAYSLDTGALVTSVELDERPAMLHGFNDMALAGDGSVYVTDSNTTAVYKLAPGGKTLELVLRDSKMSFPNGIVIAPDQRTLYVAHVEGISALDIATGERRLLGVPGNGSVNSIDGLLLKDGIFYGVQNSPYMQRIVGAALSRDGRSIDKVWTVNSRTPAEYSQTTAAIAGDDLYMVGGTPVADIYGGTNPAKPVRKIWKVPLRQE